MTEQRRRGTCPECGDDDVKMAGTHRCYKCYMRARRATAPDLHNPALRKDHVKLVKQHAKLMEVFATLRVDDGSKDAVMQTLRPFFESIAHLVVLGADTDESVPTSSGDDGDALARINRAADAVSHDDVDELESAFLDAIANQRAKWTPEARAEIMALWNSSNERDPFDVAMIPGVDGQPPNYSYPRVMDDIRNIAIKHGILPEIGESKSTVLALKFAEQLLYPGGKPDTSAKAPPSSQSPKRKPKQQRPEGSSRAD